jgi:hypothetical protein
MSVVSLASIRKNNAQIVKLLEKAVTREPKSGATEWQSSDPANMRDVITFKTEGKTKGSLERFKEANKISTKVYTMLREAVAYGAHSTQGSVNGILAFDATEKNFTKLEAKLNKIYSSRDKNKNGKLEDAEQDKAMDTKNGAALFAGRAKLAQTKKTGLRSEHKFSRQVTRVIDLMYSNGSIHGPAHIDAIADGLGKTNAAAVRAAYHAVSNYITHGQTSEAGFICMDQRREVTRGLMRIYGASMDKTETAISKVTLPSGY